MNSKILINYKKNYSNKKLNSKPIKATANKK